MKKKKCKILIVEDEPLISKILAEELNDQGFQVFTAQNGKRGLISAIEKKPDIILLDIVMPAMDGLTTMLKLRGKNQYGKKVPIIFITNLVLEDKIIQVMKKNQPVDYFFKSNCSLDAIVKRIRSVSSLII